ncbi:MAG TPA: hypothetical protein VFT43_14390, partial [Candidatus Polarisedimenticolia bacterium]|nr:hypothetical protein [Candidatus Polarisedimenticolia bacterium]
MKRRRIAAWVLGSLAALLLIAAALTLLSRVVADSARRRLETRAAAITGGPVAISRLRVGWLPPTIHIEQARADRKGSRGSEAHASVKSITIRAGLLTLLGLRQGPVSVVADDPHLAAVLLPGRLGAAKEREGTLLSSLLTRVPPGSSLTLGDGAIEIEVKGDWSVRLSGVRIESRARDGGPAIGGRILFAGGALRAGPAGDWEDLQGEGSWTLNASGLEVEALSLRGKGMALSGHARVEAGGAGVEGEIQVGMELKNLERFLPAAAAPTGHVEARLTGSWHPGALRAQGDLRAVALHLWGLQMDSLDGDLEIDSGARLKGIRAHLFGGEVTGSATLSFAPAGMTGETDLSVDGVDLAQVLAYAGWGGPPVRGTIHYRGRHRIDARGIESLRGAGLIDAVGHYVSPRGVDLPLEVTSNLETTGDTILLEGGTIRAGSVRGGFSGTVTPGDGVRLRLRGATGDISEVLPLFAPPPPRPAPQPAEPKSGGGAKGQGETHEGGRTPVRVVAYSVDAPAESPLERLVHALGGRWEWNGDLHYDRGGLSFAGLLEGTGLTFHDTRIGSLQASVRYGQESLAIAEATFHPDEGGEIRLSGTIRFRDSGSIALDGAATDCPLAPLLALAWRPLSASGKLSARFTVGGRPTAPTGRATLEAGPVT